MEGEGENDRLSERVIGCAMLVSTTLGCGFLEKVYENALSHELRKAAFAVSQQHRIVVRYDGVRVGEYAVNILVDQRLMVELKCVRTLDESNQAQCLNYLKATGLRVCLLLNFGNPRLDIRRYTLG